MTAMLWMLFTLSLSGGALALLALCLSPLLRRRPTVRYYLLLLVALRLALPVAPEANLMAKLAEGLEARKTEFTPVRMEDPPAAPQVQASPAAIVYAPTDGEDPYAGPAQSLAYAPSPEIVSGIAQTTRRLAEFGAARVLLFIWMFGACASLLPQLWGFFRLRWLLHRSESRPLPEEQAALDALCAGRRKPRLRRSGAAQTPMTFGILRPTVVLPECGRTPDELRYILLHELTHVRRFDVAYKWLMLLVTSVHWFNPLAWQLERMVSRDCELSCDAAVVGGLTAPERIAYCRTLLQAAAAGQRQCLPAAALGEGAQVMKERIESALAFRALSRRGCAGCALLLSATAILGLLLGCSDGKTGGNAGAEPAQVAGGLDGSAEIDRLCTTWAEAIRTQDTAARMALLEIPDANVQNLFAPVRGHAERRLRGYDYDFSVDGGNREWGWIEIRYVMEDDDLLLYLLSERLMLTKTDDGWRVAEQIDNAYCEPASYEELVWRTDEAGYFPEYTESDLRRMEIGQKGLYGLDAGGAAEKALHLSGGRMIRVARADDPAVAECWYHWEDGDARIMMAQPEGLSVWAPKAVEPVQMPVGSYLNARSLILNGLPGGWETEDLGVDEQYFICGVSDPDGAFRCTLRVDWRTGEIFYEEPETGRLRPYHESPIRDTLESRSEWEGEFYPYQAKDRRTIIRRIGERVFSYVRPDGSSGMGVYSGNQGWTDDGQYLYLWCADGCNLKIFPRAEDGALVWQPEDLQSDRFDIRYQERWEQNYGRARASGLAAVEAQELLESALPQGFTVEQQGIRGDWYLLATEQDGAYVCTVAVNSRNAEFRAWDDAAGEPRPYPESPVYATIAERCVWEGSFAVPGVPGTTFFWRENQDGLGFCLNGGPDDYPTVFANQAYIETGDCMYLWDCDTGDVLEFQLDDNGEIVRSDGAYYQRLTRLN